VPKSKKTAPSGSKRRVKIRRKGAAPAVDPAIAYAIAQAVEAQDIEGVRKIVLDHEAQMHHLRNILFDLMIIFREEHRNADSVVTKRRFAVHIKKVRDTLEQNVPDFKQYHKNANEIDDLNELTEDDLEELDSDPDYFDVDVAALIREAADDAARREGEAEQDPETSAEDMMDEMLERASEEAGEEWTGGPRSHPRTRARPPRGRPRR
jgi:hypothetical protein